jgi:hypothetical protein
VTYRPITDVWFLARAKLKGGRKYYGAYLGGFPERARALLGVTIHDPVLHVCGGMAKFYPYAGGFGENDKTLDLDPACEPDFLQDARKPLPRGFKALLIDPPYSEQDAARYAVGADAYPSPGKLLANAINAVPIGRRVGILHYMNPRRPPNARFVALAAISSGHNNRGRFYTVFERTS